MTRPGAAPLRRMLSLARPELKTLVLGALCLALGTAMGLLFPQIIRMIVDDATGSGKSTLTLHKAAAALGVICLIQAIAMALRHVLFSAAGERVVARLRMDLFRRLIEQEVAFFDERKTGELTSRLASDTTVLQDTVSVNISTGLRFIASAVGGLGFLLYTSPVLTLVMLSVVPPVALGVVAFGRRVQKLSGDAQDALARGGEVQVLEGDWNPQRLVILEFESMERFKEWYNSPEYAPLKQLRGEASVTEYVVVEGL